MPSLVGLPRDQAVTRLNQAGLNVVEGAPRFSKDVPAGSVMEQQPAANERVPRQSVVAIIVSNGPPVSAVPNLIGLVLDQNIENTLKQAEWDIRIVEEYSQKTYHEILGLSPVPFTQLAAGEPLTLTVSGGITLTLTVNFGDAIQLDGVLLPEDELRRGESLEMTFLWRALERIDAPYVRFIHFSDANGNIPTQADTEPSPYTTAWARNVVIRDQYFLPIPSDTPPGEYELLVGFYPSGSPSTRLPIRDAGKSVDSDSRALIWTINVLP